MPLRVSIVSSDSESESTSESEVDSESDDTDSHRDLSESLCQCSSVPAVTVLFKHGGAGLPGWAGLGAARVSP